MPGNLGGSDIPNIALNQSVIVRAPTDTTPDIIQRARKFEDYLRGDRDYNDRQNNVIAAAKALVAEYTANGTVATVTLEGLKTTVTKAAAP